jgi:hypothetical protein
MDKRQDKRQKEKLKKSVLKEWNVKKGQWQNVCHRVKKSEGRMVIRVETEKAQKKRFHKLRRRRLK